MYYDKKILEPHAESFDAINPLILDDRDTNKRRDPVVDAIHEFMHDIRFSIEYRMTYERDSGLVCLNLQTRAGLLKATTEPCRVYIPYGPTWKAVRRSADSEKTSPDPLFAMLLNFQAQRQELYVEDANKEFSRIVYERPEQILNYLHALYFVSSSK